MVNGTANGLRTWEQTWAPTKGPEADSFDVYDPGAKRTVASGASETDARLMAAAPAMARTLMILAGIGSDSYCNGCGDTANGRGHRRDCALMQLLFEAGLGELSQADRSPILRVVKP